MTLQRRPGIYATQMGAARLNGLHSASIVLALVGGIGQVAIALMGFAIGGSSTAVWLLLADGLLAMLGALATASWSTVGAASVLLAGAGALAALFSTTLLELGVVVPLVGAAALGFASRRSP